MTRQPWISSLELAACAVTLLLTGCMKLLAWTLIAGEYCSGTGTGDTRFFRICYGGPVFLSFMIVDLFPLIAMFLWFRFHRTPIRYRTIAITTYVLYCGNNSGVVYVVG